MPRPVRIVEYRAGEGDQVGIAILQRRFRLLRVGDQPHANHRDGYLLANIAGERQLVSRPNGDRLLRRQTAAGDVNIVTAQRFQLLAKLNGLLAVPAAFDPVGCRQPDAHRHGVAHCLADRLKDFQRIAHSVLQRTAVLVAALVAERREKLVQQIAVGGVQFNQLKAQPLGAQRAGDEGRFDARQIGMAQFSGSAIAIVKRHGGRGDGLPATIVERQLMASLPRGGAGCLASGMTQLDPQTDRRPGPNIFDYAAQGVFGFIIPQPQIPRRDTPRRLYRRGFQN